MGCLHHLCVLNPKSSQSKEIQDCFLRAPQLFISLIIGYVSYKQQVLFLIIWLPHKRRLAEPNLRTTDWREKKKREKWHNVRQQRTMSMHFISNQFSLCFLFAQKWWLRSDSLVLDPGHGPVYRLHSTLSESKTPEKIRVYACSFKPCKWHLRWKISHHSNCSQRFSSFEFKNVILAPEKRWLGVQCHLPTLQTSEGQQQC